MTIQGVNVQITDKKVIDRFKEKYKVNEKTGCWEWLGGKDTNGCGRFWYKNKMAIAAQIGYRIFKGEYKSHLHILHNCLTKDCVNPEHLRIGTHKDNMRDIAEQHRNGNLKVDFAMAKEMRSNGCTLKAIGEYFGATKNAVNQMFRRAENV